MTIERHGSAFEAPARLAAALRAEGLIIGPDRVEACARATAATGDFYWAGRLTLLASKDDIALYDLVYTGTRLHPHEAEPSYEASSPNDDDSVTTGEAVTAAQRGDASATRIELLRNQRFDEFTEQDLADVAASMRTLRMNPPKRRVRRRRSAATGTFNLPKTTRVMQRNGGEPVQLIRSIPRQVTPRLAFCIDVSGSMATQTRAVLLASMVFARTIPACEIFTFGTRLTRVTAALRYGSIQSGLDAAAQCTHDMGAGTRIGESLQQLLENLGSTRVVRGATVVIYSDGLECGDPAHLGHQLERLTRTARSLVWLNPLSATEGYAPLARGMAAALPWIDVFASGHNLGAFVDVVNATMAKGYRLA